MKHKLTLLAARAGAARSRKATRDSSSFQPATKPPPGGVGADQEFGEVLVFGDNHSLMWGGVIPDRVILGLVQADIHDMLGLTPLCRQPGSGQGANWHRR